MPEFSSIILLCQKSLSRQYIEELFYHYFVEKMQVYRTHMKIIGDILTTTRDELPDEQGASITYLIRKANISHGRISKILSTLVSQGLLEQNNSDGACKYKISNVGREFLQAYNTFNRFADSFGLTI